MLKRIAVLLVASGAITAAHAVDWVQADSDSYAWYDAESVETVVLKDGTYGAKAWTRIVKQKDGAPEPSEIMTMKVAVLCGRSRSLATTDLVIHDKDGNLVEEKRGLPVNATTLQEVVPGSNGDLISNALCKLANEQRYRRNSR